MTKRQDLFILSSRCPQKIAVSTYLPDGWESPMPVVVMGHGIGAVKSGGLSPFALRFNAAGYAAVTFDYIGFGASEGQPRNVLNVQHELQDFKDVVAFVRNEKQRAWVDITKIVAWGTSFGGMHVTSLISEDHDLAAAIAQCPLVDGFAGSTQMPLSRSIKLTAAAVLDVFSSILGAEKPHYVNLTSDGSTTALMASQEVVEGWARIAPDNGEDWPNIIAARSLLNIMSSRPIKRIHVSKKPYLIVLPTWDNEASLDAAERCVELAPLGEALRVGGGHFDLYEGGPAFDNNINGQLEFLERILSK